MKQATNLPKNYQNNPFYVATDGLSLLFKYAKSIAVVLIVVSALRALGSPQDDRPVSTEAATSISIEAIIVLVLILLAFGFIVTIVNGISDYASAQAAKGKETMLREALRAVFANFWSYLWLKIVMSIKILLWALLLVVPGIVMAFRYSLSGVAFFDKGLRGNAAIQHSSGLVKGAWLTTFASHLLLNLATLGFVTPLLTPGTNAVLYRQLSTVKDKKPQAHVLSWVTFFIGVLIAVAALTALIVALPYIIVALSYIIVALASEAQQ